MVNVPKKCDSCIHTQVCSKKDIFQSTINDFKKWSSGCNSQDIIVEVRCVYYGNVPTSVTAFKDPLNAITVAQSVREAFDASNSKTI